MAIIDIKKVLDQLGIKEEVNSGASTGKQLNTNGEVVVSSTPVDGSPIGSVKFATVEDYHQVVEVATKGFVEWRKWTAPQRGEVVRQVGNALRENKEALGALVSYEMGKSLQEGLGEVQEMIDICDFAVGLSRQLYGLTIASERPKHRMMEQYHPLGVIGIISAFNFPVAVWSWNTALAWVCGNACVWKPSEKTPLTAIACQLITQKIFEANGVPEGISSLVIGGPKIGQALAADTKISLVSATGSTRMGRSVAQAVAARLGKSLLELGGNNAIIITPSADLKMVVPGAVFGAVGTAGQRCTSTRRLIIHESVYDKVIQSITDAYKQIKIGNPLDENNHMGPLIDKDAVKMYLDAIEAAKKEGGKILVEGGVLTGEGYESGCYVKPVIIEARSEERRVGKECRSRWSRDH